MPSSRALFVSAAGAFLAALVVWVVGVDRGKLFSLRPADEYCGGGPVRALSWHFMPLSHRCLLTDGTFHEVLPPWVNPVFFVSLAAGFVLLGLAMAAVNRP